MTSGNDYFTSEGVDEQIEELRQTPVLDEAFGEARLVGALHRHYHIPFVAEDRAALEQVRQRLLSNHGFGDTPEDEKEMVNPLPDEPRLVTHPRRIGLTRILSGLAAVILVGALVGGWLAVTHMVASPFSSLSSGSANGPDNLYLVQNGVAYRLSGTTGKVIWQDRLAMSSQSGSANIQVVDNIVYVMLDFDLYAFNAVNGTQIWHVANHTKKAYFWFKVENGRMYLYTLDFTFSALNATDGSSLWHNTAFITQAGYGSTVQDGNLYTINDDGTQLYTLDGATGQVRWHVYLSPFTLLNPPLVANGVVYVGSSNLLYAFNEQNGTKIWEQTVPVMGTFAAAYLADGVLYITNVTLVALTGSTKPQDTSGGSFFAYSAQTGRLLWAAEPGYTTLFNFPITHGLLLVPREYKGTYSIAGLEPQTGKVAWQVPLQCVVKETSQPCSVIWTAMVNGTLYLLESDALPHNTFEYTLKSFDPDTGQLLSAHPVLTTGQEMLEVVGASDGLFYLQIGVPKTANGLPYEDYLFSAYHLSDSSFGWNHTMPLFPPPTSADVTPNTSQVVLAP